MRRVEIGQRIDIGGLVRPGVEHEGVRSRATVELVVAIAAMKLVGSGIADDGVGPCAADQADRSRSGGDEAFHVSREDMADAGVDPVCRAAAGGLVGAVAGAVDIVEVVAGSFSIRATHPSFMKWCIDTKSYSAASECATDLRGGGSREPGGRHPCFDRTDL
jgi:hypothetical protein